MNIGELKEKLKKLRIPFLPIFWRPNFTIKLPKGAFSKEETRIRAFILFNLFAVVLFAGIFSYTSLTPPILEKKNITMLISHHSYDQTIMEGIISGCLFLMGSIGTFTLRWGTKFTTERYKAVVYFYGGFLLILVSISGLMILLGNK